MSTLGELAAGDRFYLNQRHRDGTNRPRYASRLRGDSGWFDFNGVIAVLYLREDCVLCSDEAGNIAMLHGGMRIRVD